MTKRSDYPTIHEKFVVVFDICSSSMILEDLMLSDSLKSMTDLIIATKKFLRRESALLGFEVYKFIGDGWILLFPSHVEGGTLVSFLERLSRFFKEKLRKRIVPRLQSTPSVMGITFGIDKGKLVRIIMMGREEYIGRALNIAFRLQGAIKERDRRPAYKALFSKPSYKALRLSPGSYKTKIVRRTLRNIQGGERYGCVKLKLKV